MAGISQNIYITKKEKLRCSSCKNLVRKGELFVADTEQTSGICFNCSKFTNYTLLAPGDAALTRRSKKHSELCGVVLGWNQRRKRFERKGQYVEADAIKKAKIECQADQAIRTQKNKKAAQQRIKQDQTYVENFAQAIRRAYPNCPPNREFKIAEHACEKYSRRVGRTAAAKQFDKKMIDMAVEAHIRHLETNYDQQFGKGKPKREIREDIKFDVNRIMMQWRNKF